MGSNDWWRPEDAALEAAPTLPLLSRDRVAAILEKNDWSFGTDDDGDLIGTWDDTPFWFVLTGQQKEILQVVCQCRKTFEPNQLLDLQRALDDWNRDKIWPRAYFRTRPQTGALVIFGDVAIDYEKGVTDDQIEQQLHCAIDTGVEMCRHFSNLDSDEDEA